MQAEYSERRQEAFKNVDEQIARLLENVRFLREARNQIAPVSNLPDETLRLIFQLSCSQKPYNGKCQVKRQLVLTWVARKWRKLAVGFPRLWNHINYTRPPALIEAVILRAEQAKLEVEVEYNKEEMEKDISFILKALPIIGSLRITTGTKYGYSWHYSRGPRMTLNALPQWKTETNSLTTLSLSHVCLPDDMFGGVCASLNTVTLVNCQFPWPNFPSLPALKSFKVVSPTQKASIVDVIAVLRTMPNLITLDLSSILSDSQGAPTDMDIDSSPSIKDTDSDSDSGDDEATKSEQGGSDLGDDTAAQQEEKELADVPDLSEMPLSLDNLQKIHIVQGDNSCTHLPSLLSRLRIPNVVELSVKSNGDASPVPLFQAIVKTRPLDNIEWRVRSLGIVTSSRSFQYTLDEEGGRRTFLHFGHSPQSMDVITDALNPLEFSDTRPLSVELLGPGSYPYSDASFISFFETLGELHVSSLIMQQEHTPAFLTFIENVIEKSPKVRVRKGNGGRSYYRCKRGTGAGSDDEDATPFYSLRNLHLRNGFMRGAMKHWKVLLRWLANYREGVRIDTLTFEDFETPPPSSMMEEFRKVVKEVVLL